MERNDLRWRMSELLAETARAQQWGRIIPPHALLHTLSTATAQLRSALDASCEPRNADAEERAVRTAEQALAAWRAWLSAQHAASRG